jgi:hypothetical protein
VSANAGPRAIAVDWSGATEPLRSLWLAEADKDRVLDVRSFPTRQALVEHLISERKRNSELVVGLDFAFSLPAWFLDQHHIAGARELWEWMRTDADEWLTPKNPFWGKGGVKRPSLPEEYRQTDKDLREVGKRPSSAFKLVGAGQVGTSSLRGMPCLAMLQDAGFNVWPFAGGTPLVIEIYPATLSDLVGKQDPTRIAAAVRDDSRIPAEWKAHAACCQDAFDAAVSALRMAEHVEELAALHPARANTAYAREGQIWFRPDWFPLGR